MLNVEMLDLIGRPGGFSWNSSSGGEQPPLLRDVFARIVREGWAPRHPCTDPDELARLSTSTTRGDCIAPLIVAGDTVYVDPSMPPEPGDIVSFAVSQRLADAQNANPPTGQLPTWRAGDRWLKLFVPYQGIDMLHERHGGSLTTTFACCESPDDTPIFHPMRQIRRDGRLLFTPDTFSGQIGQNAATDIYSASLIGPSTSGTQVGVFAVTVAVPVVSYAHTAIVTMTCDAWRSSGGGIWVECDLHGTTTGGVTSEERFLTQSASPGERATIQYEFPNLAGTALDYTLQFNTGSPSNTITVQNVRMQVEIIKR